MKSIRDNLEGVAMALIQNGTVVGDGSWILKIFVTDLRTERALRVNGGIHIGGLMLRLVEELDVTRDWSDHALWWPIRRRWLTHTRSTLDQMGVTADSRLEFTPMHKVARIQLPDLQEMEARLDFSVPVLNAVIQLCRELGIRYPEELSLKRTIHPENLKKGLGFESDNIRSSVVPSSKHAEEIYLRNQGKTPGNMNQALSQSAQNISHPVAISAGHTAAPGANNNNSHTMDNRGRTISPPPGRGGGHHQQSLPPQQRGQTPALGTRDPRAQTPLAAPIQSPRLESQAPQARAGPPERILQSISFGEGLSAEQFDQHLISSPPTPVRNAQEIMLRPKTYEQKAALNRGWLDSTRSLMEQGIFEQDTVQLRFKFSTFFDLNPKYDPVRLNQLFEQAKWSVIMEELDCTEEEALMFAALQLQATLNANAEREEDEGKDDVDCMLSDLEQQLAGVSSTQSQDLMHVPELGEYLKYFKPKKLTLKGWKRAFFTFRDLYLSWYPTAQDVHGPPIGRISLKGCEVTPDVNIGQNKYCIKLLVPSAEGMSEFYLKCDSDKQYARFLAGCRLASRGKTMADASFASEMDSINRLLAMQHPHGGPHDSNGYGGGSGRSGGGRGEVGEIPPQMRDSLNPEDYLPLRIVRKARTREQLLQRIQEAHGKVKNLTGKEAKMQYVRALQALPEHGIHYFVVRFRGAKKHELLGIAYNRMMKMNLDTGETMKTWRFSTMKKWHVNWEIKHVLIQTDEENVEFKSISADCKVPHEFIGGYVFLSMRSKDQNQTLNEEMFHKLTGGWG